MHNKKQKFEPGIYNYCDRWCEKCKKTDHCLLFFKEQQGEQNLVARGIDPRSIEGSLEMVKMSLGETFSLIQKTCEEEGIDLERTKEEDWEYELFDRKTDPKNLALYKKANHLFKEISDWLSSVPSLDIDEYREAYENVAWHHSLIFVKTTRALRSYLEYKHEDDDTREFSLDDAIKSAWVALRSTTICRDSFELMDGYVGDPRIVPIIEKCDQHQNNLQKQIDKMAKKP